MTPPVQCSHSTRGNLPSLSGPAHWPDRGNINWTCPEERRLFPFVGSAHCFVWRGVYGGGGGGYLFRCKSASKSVTSCPCVAVGQGESGSSLGAGSQKLS